MSSKTALVTGTSSGIGKITARELKAAGFTVYAAARRVENMQDLKAEGITPVALDLAEDASIQSCVSEVLAQAGRIDVLVNNAGYGSYGAH